MSILNFGRPFFVYCKAQMANPCGRKFGFKAGISCSVTKKTTGINTSAYVNRYNAYFFVARKSRFLLYKTGDKPKTLQIAYLLQFELNGFRLDLCCRIPLSFQC